MDEMPVTMMVATIPTGFIQYAFFEFCSETIKVAIMPEMTINNWAPKLTQDQTTMSYLRP